MTERRGRCLCGAVTFAAARLGDLGACHCRMCQQWAGGPFLGVNAPQDALTVSGPVVTRRSSAWASRSRCGECGSPLWYRWDKGEDGAGDYEIALGLFDDANGLRLRHEIYIDAKPDGFALAGDHPRKTTAEMEAEFAP